MFPQLLQKTSSGPTLAPHFVQKLRTDDLFVFSVFVVCILFFKEFRESNFDDLIEESEDRFLIYSHIAPTAIITNPTPTSPLSSLM